MAPATQQAVLVTDFGDGSHDLRAFVSVGEAPVVQPAAGEVLVKLLLRPVNPAGEAACACNGHPRVLQIECRILYTG